uniref:Spectrin repeat containing, nuclear envelope family member 3 n=1 Tax=Gasterosteus aculeatus aculeatus TaxID=481459 RepID=A0AAQ4RN95_GASAC
MTQQEQQEFTESLEAALSWMRAIQKRLKANDNTQGPLEALQGRLRETEKIHQSEHEGRVKMDMALAAADNLLQNGDDELRNHTHTKLKDLKNLWEETTTYIIHCHSRIEWVWLHWSEYLKAHEEFELWLTSRQRSLDVVVELQLGAKEKLWQVDQQRVVVSDIHGQAALLERLLDEAGRAAQQDPGPQCGAPGPGAAAEAYSDVRDRAEERLSLLQRTAEEHQTYQGCVQRFQSWLLSKTTELTDLVEREDSAENKLKALQALDDSIAGEEKTLQHIEAVAEAVRGNTSPSGAEVVMEEAEELRLRWQRLRQGLFECEEGLRSSLDSHSQYVARCQRLGDDIGQLRVLLQGLDLELEEGREGRGHTDRTEEQMVGQWKKYTDVRNTLTGEESQVELLKAQLKELFRFSEDSRHLSDDVLAVVKEHQSVKCRATRLCSESESGLRSVLQDPLVAYRDWAHMVSQLLEASAEVTDFSHIDMLVQSIERLLKGSAQLQERLSLLQVKGHLLDSVFGPEGSDSLQGELGAAVRNRELLHAQLLQSKSRLQGSVSRSKDFGDAHELICCRLAALQDQLGAADGLQPDILAKKSQSDQFRVILKDLEDCEAPVTALETLVSSSQSNKAQYERLHAEWKHLHKAARVKVHDSEESISAHESFHDSLLNLEKWLMIMRQRLESFHSPPAEWSVEGRQHEAERALGEFPEKELQLQQMEVQGQAVLERTSEEGRVHILRDIRRLQESWFALYDTSLNLHRLLDRSTEQTHRHAAAGGRSPEGEGAATGRRGGAQGRGEGHLCLDERVDGRPSFTGDQVDSSAWRVGSRAGQRGSAGSPGREATPLTPEAAEGRSPGGGAFMLYRREPTRHQPGGTAEYQSRRREFEAWLSQENKLLSGICSSRGKALSTKEVRSQQDTLTALRAAVGRGHEQFQLLLQESPASDAGQAEDVRLEELRYRWMLYKSKLKDVGDLRSRAKRIQAGPEEPASTAKVQKKAGLCRRVCRLALLLWLLLLALLLLALLLPLMDGGHSCSLSNNFARSFNIMLRYEGPPPT